MLKIFKKITLVATFAGGLTFAASGYAQQTTPDFFSSVSGGLSEQSVENISAGTFPDEDNPGMNLPIEAEYPRVRAEDVLSEREALKNAIREQAFEAAITGLFPLNVDEIRKLLKRFDDSQQAVEVPVYPYPKPEVVTHTIALDPGAEPPVIKVATGHVAVVAFVDSTGAPWPIGSVAWAGNFELIQSEEGGNIVSITPMSEFAHGNMAITLLELIPPVVFQIKTSRDTVHYRFDARIPEPGPFAQVPLIMGAGGSMSAGNGVIGSILEGVPPMNAVKLSVAGVDGRTSAYQVGGSTYVRTPLKLLSPGWNSSVSSADGMNVYALREAPVILLSDRGQVVRARLTEGVNLNDQ